MQPEEISSVSFVLSHCLQLVFSLHYFPPRYDCNTRRMMVTTFSQQVELFEIVTIIGRFSFDCGLS